MTAQNQATGAERTSTRSLAELTAGVLAVPTDIVVSDVTLDSRLALPGSLFLACRGRGHHGLEFAGEAVARGARAVLYEEGARTPSVPELGDGIFVAGVAELSRVVGTIADRFFGAPSRSLAVAGVTGTNGKTTCAYLLAQALTLCGRSAAYMGTLGYGAPRGLRESSHTTADAVTVHRRLAELAALGAECVGMEVSSHALDQERVAGVRFHTAAFTNLTRDHLDYHGTMEHYAAAKTRLLEWPALALRVINVDDATGAALAALDSTARLVVTTRKPRVAHHPEFVAAAEVVFEPAALAIAVESSWGAAAVRVPLIGDFNVDNVLTVLAVLLAWNVPLAAALDALARCQAPPGRMEALTGAAPGPTAIVDYAHTPDALAKALGAARAHCAGKLRLVFGCGGDRDPGKRPLMGRIAAELADEVLLTDDNPRSEDPRRIVAAICAGIAAGNAVSIDHDRARAIGSALAASGPADLVLIAGKGHEAYQIYGAERRPFSDQAVVRTWFEAAQ